MIQEYYNLNIFGQEYMGKKAWMKKYGYRGTKTNNQNSNRNK